jgi:hypothetical protein
VNHDGLGRAASIRPPRSFAGSARRRNPRRRPSRASRPLRDPPGRRSGPEPYFTPRDENFTKKPVLYEQTV